MNKDREELIRLVRKDMLESLTNNDGENLRKLYKTKLTKKARKDLERMSQHPALKRFIPH
jgi:hypothetical protein